ncbi:metal-dependent hydrolase [Paenibacillus sp. GCM10023248]|uniref:metal-dependent hydrolase n=1 Tax=Bacillales TaxID=1385 RepID=UPI002379D6D7|nr:MULTISPECIES: metal-dependent hydrolase [Bacillales]MDD9268601.1 metal-dependent hydrolase [Paenibacillus sp. MAHUQ-63]MDR6879500.1 inner membrane protein [Bacillus sp. 3255]
MDTITHLFMGLSLYGAVDKGNMTKKERYALLFTTATGSQIPDIDVISSLWDTAGRYQMWHRGLTHSVFLVPVWAAIITGISKLLWKTQRIRLILMIALLAVFIHDTIDLFNAWGTGYFEPFSPMRVTFGTIPIVDLVFWAFMGAGLLTVRFVKNLSLPSHRIHQLVWLCMALHVAVQSAQGVQLYKQYIHQYEQVALAADFVPGVFTVIGKKGENVDLLRATLWGGASLQTQLVSKENSDLEKLFATNTKARTLKEWSPFVVVVDDDKVLGVYDPRFYRNGESFLFEYIEKQ